MNLLYRADQEQSLNVMWHAYLAATPCIIAKKLPTKNAATVGHAFLNARYYDSGRGQFLSEDPVFWEVGQTQDGKAVLTNPQAMNSYSYANGNPVVNKDPKGRCIEDACVVEGAIVTSPMWMPIVAATAATVTYEMAALMRSSGGGNRMRAEPFDTSRLVGLPEPPSPFDFGPPDLPPNLSKWMKWAIAGTLIVGEVSDEYSKFEEAKNDMLNFVKTSNSNAQNNSQGQNAANRQPTRPASQNSSTYQTNTSQSNSRIQSVLSQLSSALSQLNVILSGGSKSN